MLALVFGLVVFAIWAKAQPGPPLSPSTTPAVKFWDEASRGYQAKVKIAPITFLLLLCLTAFSFLQNKVRYARVMLSFAPSTPNRISESRHWFRPPPLS